METLELSRKEVLALRRFRNTNDTGVIKGLLERLLFVDRDNYVGTEANEELRLRVKADQRIIRLLFESELNLEVPNEG